MNNIIHWLLQMLSNIFTVLLGTAYKMISYCSLQKLSIVVVKPLEILEHKSSYRFCKCYVAHYYPLSGRKTDG